MALAKALQSLYCRAFFIFEVAVGKVESPCISQCKIKDEVCQGCGRKRSEIKGWKEMKDKARKEVIDKSKKRLKKLKKG
ncbi:hypothetical protein thsps117_41050 [Pseudomonas sp. No.117]|jgi:predicted Fe-S protein YdhL (DUF1289 family)